MTQYCVFLLREIGCCDPFTSLETDFSVAGFVLIWASFYNLSKISMTCYNHFRWYTTLENKTPAEMLPNFCQSCVLLTDWIEIHHLQPQVWPSNLLYGLWLVDFDPICLTSFSIACSTEENMSWKVFCLTSSKSWRDTQVISSAFASAIWSWIILVNGQITKTQAFALFSSSFATTKDWKIKLFPYPVGSTVKRHDFKANLSLM